MRSQHSMPFVAGALAFALALPLAAPPAAAADPRRASAPQPLREAAEAYVANADLGRARAAQETAPAAGRDADKPFFKTGRGIAAAVLMTAGLAWLFYTKSHDRVTSPANR